MPMTTCSLRTAVCCAPVFLIASLAAAATLPARFGESLVAGGLSHPTAMTFAPDGRLFVCEQSGTLRVIKNGALLSTPFVSLNVNDSGERGLLGVAFDPAFASNRYVYVYYTATTPNVHNRVSRFTASGDVALTGSEVVLLDLEPLGATNHNGGAIHFGPDGKLYVAVGENAVSSNAQTLNNRLGKILRLNANGSIPEDNPFFGTATGPNRAIWALGLRNPFTFAFQPLSGTMFINDVGENSWEEINPGVAGANYGWPATEGYTPDPRFQSPLHAYGHSDGCAISGGAFHSPFRPDFPFRFWGAYFFADFCGGWIRSRLSNGTVVDFASGISRPVDVASATDGSLYYLARGFGSTSGVVYRIAYSDQAPRVDLTANGGDGPLLLPAGSPMQIDVSFDAGSPGVIGSAEMYIGVFTPFGLFWVDPARGFVPTLTRFYAGALPSFGPSTLLSLPDVDLLPPGLYLWLILVDEQVDGLPAGDYSDFVLTGTAPS
jgi:glucose/arabinose dehydrogenase